MPLTWLLFSGWQDLIRRFREVELGGRMILATYGSAPSSPEVIAWFAEVLGYAPMEGYGSTEVSMITINNKIQRQCVPALYNFCLRAPRMWQRPRK
jgi:fatty acid CoA ligase FadD9